MRFSLLSGRPLLATRIDRELFSGRDGELRRVRRALDDRLNCVLTGDPGSGRTSLLHRVLADLDTPQVLLRGAAVADAVDLLDRITVALAAPEAAASLPTPAAATTGHDGLPDRIERLRRQLTGSARPLIAIDDLPPAAGLELFGRHRDELWTVDTGWLVTVSTAHASTLLRPPADVFFDVRVDLQPLDPQQAELLLRRRIDADDSVDLPRVIEAAHGNPRRLIELARSYSATDPDAAAAAIDAIGARTATLATMSVPARMLAAELESLGSAAASDAALLDRLGWTRPRAVQVLKQLQAAGLVVATDERSGPGRPRKVYRLVTER